ncbi:MAG TPA: acyl-CoA thioesterase [Planctomycetaceae bacterium]|nr:thioesterase [Blastopirellula sp.]HAY80894.1 acyl-CoA thioesterase [Planctomycetaceae bacterium]|tara:strand:- start:769 stop:1209 length:441 start_codon:yes stop_codon:yes gene_type:complete
MSHLNDYSAIISIPIQWGDQDAFGHVNNTVPIRWFESSRIAFLDACGLGEMMTGEGVGPILAAVTCNYRKQIRFPDTVHIGARTTNIGRTSMTVEHAVFSDSQQGIAAEGESVIVVFDYATQRPIRISDAMRAKLVAMNDHHEPRA